MRGYISFKQFGKSQLHQETKQSIHIQDQVILLEWGGLAMLIPIVIDPRDLVPAGGELDSEREIPCLCGRQAKLGAVKLVWANFGDGYGYRAVCCQGCIVIHFAEEHRA